jgi:arylsulfatase A-like enzyme
MPAAPEKLYAELPASPFGNNVVEAMAERAIHAEQLGRRGVTDLLAVSFSSNDYIGHRYGPDSPEVREVSIRTDRLIDQLFACLEKEVGMANVLVVLTADHGVAPLPEVQAARRMPGGRLSAQDVGAAVQAALEKRYGPGDWITAISEQAIYLNLDLIARNNLDRADVARAGASAALTVPHVFRAYTRERLMNGAAMEDQVGRRVMNGYSMRRGGDIIVLLEPYWMFTATGTTHSATYSYDAHVPLIFMGAGIRPGLYFETVAVNDLAPTLAAILQVETPSGSMGRVLDEIFAAPSGAL